VYLNFPHNLVFVHFSQPFNCDFAKNVAKVCIVLKTYVSIGLGQKNAAPEMRLTDTSNTLHTWVPSTPPPEPLNYPHSVEGNIHISYEAYDPFSCCLSDLSSRLGGTAELTVWRTVIQWVSVDKMISWFAIGALRASWNTYCVGIEKKDLHG
jgi:hypothetical protein